MKTREEAVLLFGKLTPLAAKEGEASAAVIKRIERTFTMVARKLFPNLPKLRLWERVTSIHGNGENRQSCGFAKI
jgi:hypothetical protein